MTFIGTLIASISSASRLRLKRIEQQQLRRRRRQGGPDAHAYFSYAFHECTNAPRTAWRQDGAISMQCIIPTAHTIPPSVFDQRPHAPHRISETSEASVRRGMRRSAAERFGRQNREIHRGAASAGGRRFRCTVRSLVFVDSVAKGLGEGCAKAQRRALPPAAPCSPPHLCPFAPCVAACCPTVVVAAAASHPSAPTASTTHRHRRLRRLPRPKPPRPADSPERRQAVAQATWATAGASGTRGLGLFS
jgi:hypothetical protein